MYFVRSNTLTPCTATTGSYRYPTWVSGQTYNKNEIVRDATANADFKCRVYAYSSTTRPGAAYWYYWSRLNSDGNAAVGQSTYKSTFGQSGGSSASLYDAWAGSTAVVKGERTYDSVAHRDYEALVAMTSGVNALRPSSAVISTDLTVAGRWLDLGPSNLFSLFDDDASTLATATSSAYVIFDVAGATSLDTTDCIAIIGLSNVGTVTVYALNPANDAVLSTTVIDLNYSPATVMLKDLTILAFTAVLNPRLKVKFDAGAGSPLQSIAIGKILAGKKVDFGATAENVNVSITDFSAKVVDDTFGTYRFIKRGFSKNISAQIMVEHAQGDQFSQYIEQARAVPTIWDFNTAGQTLARVMVYGWYKNYSCVVSGIPWDTYSLEVAGLVS